MSRVHHSRPTTGPEEPAAITQVLAGGHHARGPRCRDFESQLASAVGLPHAHATSSGTTALELCLRALGAGSGRSVLIPSLTCAAVWNAVRNTGAEAVFYDSGYQPPPAKAIDQLVRPDTACVVLVAALDGEASLAEQGYVSGPSGTLELAGVPIVLDRCQQLSQYHSSEARAVAEIFSFYATKCITTGTGGAVATASNPLYQRMVDLNSHDGRDDYQEPRFNYQFDDVRATLGLVQLRKLGGFVRRRRELADAYRNLLADSGIELRADYSDGIVFRWLAGLADRATCDLVANKLSEAGIEAKRPVFRPLHRYAGLPDSQFTTACQAWDRWLSLPIYPGLSAFEQERIATEVKTALKG